ncbi:MAG: Respiratory nitrate reductase 1 alpha chain [Candidatus Heimdallarchaeota archaeon LC_2]|nr:MAG: Respiratory nitrate reductase 1 alpha chain [Candidatus Heimdallarchaeota archaeon LC_2]
MSWIQDLTDPKSRHWEEFYRNRWQHDKVVRSTHGVNCTGGCSWMVFVKDGIVTWEMQAVDYPLLEKDIPPYEPRGCQRGISASWYVYSPIRVKYPYIRGALRKLWRAAKAEHKDPLKAWASIVEDDDKRKIYQIARGKGGFRRTIWSEVNEIIAASCLYTAKQWGPDRVFGFSPIPAMSYLSYGAGSRFLQLFGGVNLSFYDWYSDLPNAFPEVWGEQTDVCESADWYNSKYVVSMGSNLNMTRTPDVHFISEARINGSKFVVFAPDFSQAAKYADWWIPIKAGQDAAFWMAVNHVIMKEYHVDTETPYFIDYLKQYADTPFLIELLPDGDNFKPGQLLRANKLKRYKDVENGDWKLLVYDSKSNEARMPKGTIGFRYGADTGKWNLKPEDGLDDSQLDPALTLIEEKDDEVLVSFYAFKEEKTFWRGVPVKKLKTTDRNEVLVTTVYDLLMAHLSVDRGLSGDYAKDYNDINPYTPAWQEQYTGIGKETVIRFAREFAQNARDTEGKSMVIIGAGINHWYHNNLNYRAPITALILTGCVGKNGGGMNHYVGQEKLTLIAPWSTLAFALDWIKPARLQQAPLWHYMNTDQWRYEGDFTDYAPVPPNAKYAKGHVADHIVSAVRMGWMPYYPQFNKSSVDILKEAESAGNKTDEDKIKWVLSQLKEKKVQLSVEDPDAKENWPRVWFIWRGNALMSSSKGHEYFLRHYLGTHDNAIKDEKAQDYVKEVKWHEKGPRGKMDLVVDINFRMDTSALYSDIVLPTAMWYEKNDLNTTDLHSFVHPLGAAVPPSWESKSDWDIFKGITKTISEMVPKEFSEPFNDLVVGPLKHDSIDEISQPEIMDWGRDGGELIPGKTTSHYKIVERNYTDLYNRFISFGPLARRDGISGHGNKLDIADIYDELLTNPSDPSPDPKHMRTTEWGGNRYPSLEDALDAANLILRLAPESNGELAYRAFKAKEERTGLKLRDLAENERSVQMTFEDLKRQPRRTLTTPFWSGIVNKGRAYAGYTMNVDKLVPWRTLTGRQHLYLDHPYYIDFGEHLPTYKSKLDPMKSDDITQSKNLPDSLVLNYLTPHGKWHIHSTYYDNHRMLTLSRGMEPCWINHKDAEKIGLKDNDWVEVINDNGVMVTRAVVSARVQPGSCMIYHSPERTISMPKSQLRGKRRGGGHNSVTRIKLNPLLLAGGYAQFSYGFNYWGPVGVNRDTFVVVKKLSKLEW